MRKIDTISELQKVNTILLKELYKIAFKYNLKVYLIGGSMLGAVRHRGFIPWDDDIDVSISRNDYEKLIEICNNETTGDYTVINPESNFEFNGYIPQFVYKKSKMLSKQYRQDENLCIGISIFIYDGVPENKVSRWFYYKKMFVLRTFHALCRANFKYVNTKKAKIFGPILQPFFSTKKIKKYKQKILEYQKKYNYKSSTFVAPNSDANADREIVLKRTFEKEEKIKFENIECYVPINYIEHLKKYYGDYMKLPPIDKRKPKHSFTIWVDEDIFL